MTIRDVAKRAGVSIATVSRVLNGSDRVSEQAKLSVISAMEALNYQKPPAKRKKPTKLFAVIVRNMSNPFFTQLVDVLEEEAYKHGRSILLFNSRNNLQLEKTFLSECINHKVDGVFLIPRSLKKEHLEPLGELPFPVVLLTATDPTVASIGTHHQHGGEQVACYFAKRGYRRIGFIGASDIQSDRFIGFQTELKSRDILLDTKHVLAPYTTESLTEYIQHLIVDNSSPLEAVFCSDDISASHLFNGLKSVDSQLLERVDIVGFDDTFIAQSLGFSSVKQPIHQIALLGFDMMMELIQIGESFPKAMLLEPTVVIRHTPKVPSISRSPEILRNNVQQR
ncbi:MULTISPECIES: LacI family DNA-binding transcriptional regulator [Vibrio]|uniref:LacI family DNA-binding transcriptional regulator n=1 Tax=Vibrio TaxID=662 RepID=UPI0003020963|nr:LacI family DNA-binding transcriptional regulator [Vibrio tasmaniensis]OEF91786.1 LacI family transcriptional regulator [Vibrio tasmaniensis 1F-155]PMO79383.1 LacI family transcriptional regulator [Vibrio tasmaniensis]